MMRSVIHKVEDALSHLSTSTQSDKQGTAVDGSSSSTSYLAADELQLMHRWWSAANYLTIGQIYLQANPLLRRPLTVNDIKPRLLGHWGTSPGLSLLYCHMNRLIKANSLNAIFLVGPGHGGPAIVASTYLEGTYTGQACSTQQHTGEHMHRGEGSRTEETKGTSLRTQQVSTLMLYRVRSLLTHSDD